jgi:hypothetical protein
MRHWFRYLAGYELLIIYRIDGHECVFYGCDMRFYGDAGGCGIGVD